MRTNVKNHYFSYTCPRCGTEYYKVDSEEAIKLWARLLKEPVSYNENLYKKNGRIILLESKSISTHFLQSARKKDEPDPTRIHCELQRKYGATWDSTLGDKPSGEGVFRQWKYLGLPVYVELIKTGKYTTDSKGDMLEKSKLSVYAQLTEEDYNKYKNAEFSCGGCPVCGNTERVQSNTIRTKDEQNALQHLNDIKNKPIVVERHSINKTDVNTEEYLKMLIDTSESIYLLEELLKHLCAEEMPFKRTIYRRKTVGKQSVENNGKKQIEWINSKIRQKENEIASAGILGKELIKEIADRNGLDYEVFSNPPERPKLPEEPSYEEVDESLLEPIDPPAYKTPGFFNKAKIEKENENLKNTYENMLSLQKAEEDKQRRNNNLKNKYNKLLKGYEQDCATYDDRRNKYTETKKAMDELLEREREKAISELKPLLENELQELIKSRETISDEISTGAYFEKELLKDEQYSSAWTTFNFYEKERTEVEELLVKQYECRKNLLSLDIIFPKYNDLIAWSTMYEYFVTGRVSELSGPNGAYNLYESELRQNIIISKLDIIITKLEEIKQNQFMLYKMLSEVNTNLKDMSTSMNNLVDEMKKSNVALDKIYQTQTAIEYNTRKAAVYSEITSKASTAMLFMKAIWG